MFNVSSLLNASGLTGFSDIGSVVTKLLPYILGVAGFILVIYIVIAGLQLMFSMGNDKAVAAAKGRITNGIFGFVIILTAYLIAQLIGKILGVEKFGGTF